MKILAENRFGHGAIGVNRVHRFLNRRIRGLAAATSPFDWQAGYRAPVPPLAIKDQGQSFSCGGQAGSYYLEVRRALTGINERLSAKSIYAPIAYAEGGTTVIALETQVASRGANTQDEVPDSQIESVMQDTSWENNQLAVNALKRAGYIPQTVHIDIDSMASAIRDNGGIIIEIRGQNNGSWLSSYPKPPVGRKELWNHFMCSKPEVMMRNGVKTLAFYQSWGDRVGDKGVQYFTEEYINSGHILDCFTFIDDHKIVPIETNESIWANITRWFRLQPWFA